MRQERGYLITFEGSDGAGKTTQVKLLQRRLTKLGKRVVVCRDPGGDSIAQEIRNILLDPKNKQMSYQTELWLFEAARAQLYQQTVLPALKQGKIVLSDRGPDDSIVYQGIARGVGESQVRQLNRLATKGVVPDLTFLLDVPGAIGWKRKRGDKQDRFDLEAKTFHRQVSQAYLRLARKHPRRWLIIDASQSIAQVEEVIWQEVAQRLGLNKATCQV